MANVLRIGSRGDDVRALQQALIAAGARIQADGVYGPQTASAVAAFQQQAGLPVDGMAGPQTQAAMQQQAQRAPMPTPVPRPQAVVNAAPRQPMASTAAPIGPVAAGGPLPPPLGPVQGPIRQAGVQGPTMPGPMQGPTMPGPMQGPPGMAAEALGPQLPQIATAQTAPPQDMWQAPGNANYQRQNQPYPGIEALMGDPTMSWPPPGPSIDSPQPMPVGGLPQIPNMARLPQGGRSYEQQQPLRQSEGIESFMADSGAPWGGVPRLPGDIPAAPASFAGGPPDIPNMAILPEGGRDYGNPETQRLRRRADLVKQFLDQGMPLRDAVERADLFLTMPGV
jgi:peptidoglycan hydrolase-like protein with peptidoglycan-binding domain